MQQMKRQIEVKNSLAQVQFEFSKRKTNCNFEVTLYSAEINQIFQVLQFRLGKNDEAEYVVRNNVSDDELPDAAESDYDIPLASLAGASTQETSNKQG